MDRRPEFSSTLLNFKFIFKKLSTHGHLYHSSSAQQRLDEFFPQPTEQKEKPLYPEMNPQL